MTLQNRVDPAGDIHADPAKGRLMGNRGCLHDANHNIVRREATKRWIACTLEPIFGKRPKLMQPGSYTELFFLDEATALAAGHRPCAQCRRSAYRAFVAAWRDAGLPAPTAGAMADAIDKVLDVERRAPRKPVANVSELPSGAMVKAADGAFLLVHEGTLFPWSFAGYGLPIDVDAIPGTIELVTPPSIVGALRAGYRIESDLPVARAAEGAVVSDRS
jgi:hypothetical protein